MPARDGLPGQVGRRTPNLLPRHGIVLREADAACADGACLQRCTPTGYSSFFLCDPSGQCVTNVRSQGAARGTVSRAVSYDDAAATARD